MSTKTCRLALANLPFPATPAESVALAVDAIRQAGAARADLVCFPEAYVPGYRAPGHRVASPDAGFLERAWTTIGEAAQRSRVGVVLGTERVVDAEPRPLITTLVLNGDGTREGWQDKVQLDPSEESIYAPGSQRRIFSAGGITFGIAICHEAWRYPETVRFAARRGAEIVFVPHFHEAAPGSFRPAAFAETNNTFYEKALLCRAAENTCFVAAVNYASDGSPTTSAVIRPDGSVLAWQPYGRSGLLVVDVDLDGATRLMASRYKPEAF